MGSAYATHLDRSSAIASGPRLVPQLCQKLLLRGRLPTNYLEDYFIFFRIALYTRILPSLLR